MSPDQPRWQQQGNRHDVFGRRSGAVIQLFVYSPAPRRRCRSERADEVVIS
jgi:hypothetical protein